MRITSVQNERVKQAVKLRDRKGRDAQGRFFVDGPRELEQALQGKLTWSESFVCREYCRSPQWDDLIDRLAATGAPMWEVTPAVADKLAYGERASGVTAVAEIPPHDLESLVLRETPGPHGPAAPLIVVLENVEKPGNLGAAFRTADAVGASAVLAADPGTDFWNPNVVRASLGTVFRMPLASGSTPEVSAWLTRHGVQVCAARTDADTLYTSFNFLPPTALVFGSEAHGLSDLWRPPLCHSVRIPMHGLADSLNVSSTAAVLLYEALRQRSL